MNNERPNGAPADRRYGFLYPIQNPSGRLLAA
jgi:hypothetical protein